MHDLLVPDIALVEKWLGEAGYESYICDQCSGLHISALQSSEGVLDSRLFVEPWGLMFTTELDLRTSAVLAVSADMPRLNMSFPTLKLFVNTPDEATPMLMASSSLLTTQGVTVAQFHEYFGVAMETVRQLMQECQQMQFLYLGEEPLLSAEPEEGAKHSYH
ncbi:YbjN domain-containing protein [Parendozoicomonas haliclonae]|uniref:Putative bacterial sensory transduction regulator n=1 Tax=Parendozoicomonas haliclonae TaxID=1960125 RepID=A0A1X7AHQ5_9GAMM|nr:YbjN domain-containing protein [Parendozoicomonas haliclonae]SMA42258.1 putative bacterial sensory transduction regulator [Parendozoicomonas haliclonae]